MKQLTIPRLVKLSSIIVLILGVFVYGVGVGKFSWFPHDILSNISSMAGEMFSGPVTKRQIRHVIGYEILIKTEGHSEHAIVVDSGEDERGRYIEIEEPLQNVYPTESEIRLSDNEYLSEIKGSLNDFKDMGFAVKHFTYPYNANDEMTQKIVSEYYDSARASGRYDGYERGVNIPQKPLNTYALYSAGLDNASEEEVTAILDEIVRENALGIVYFHSDRTTERRIIYLIDTAIDKGIDIITRSEALKYFGNPNMDVERPALVIEYDDTQRTDYTLAFPVHKERGNVPGNIAAVSDFVGTPGYLTKEQMHEMVDEGWEIVSHSRSHAYLRSALYTSKQASTGDSRVYVSVK